MGQKQKKSKGGCGPLLLAATVILVGSAVFNTRSCNDFGRERNQSDRVPAAAAPVRPDPPPSVGASPGASPGPAVNREAPKPAKGVVPRPTGGSTATAFVPAPIFTHGGGAITCGTGDCGYYAMNIVETPSSPSKVAEVARRLVISQLPHYALEAPKEAATFDLAETLCGTV